MMGHMVVLLTIIVTLFAYLFSRFIFLKYQSPLLNVVLLGASMVIATLLLLDIPYSSYIPAKDIMTFLLGPATVALAIPLYRSRDLLKKYGFIICVSVAAGSTVSMAIAMLIAKLGGLSNEVIISAGPKSVTAPIAIEIAQISGGDPGLAVAFVVATGVFGAAVGPALLNWFKISNPSARGLALGTVAHALGVVMALMENEESGAMASAAMALAAIFTSIIAPFMIFYFLAF